MFVFVGMFIKILLVIHFYPVNLSFKFNKDPNICYRDIWKIVATFFHCNVPQKSSKMIITEWLWIFFKTRYQNKTKFFQCSDWKDFGYDYPKN